MVGTVVNVDSGVKVFRGVDVKVAIEVDAGITASVCAEAALAVCTINVPIALGSSGGMGVGVAREGTHPIINEKVIDQINSFILGAAMFSFYISVSEGCALTKIISLLGFRK